MYYDKNIGKRTGGHHSYKYAFIYILLFDDLLLIFAMYTKNVLGNNTNFVENVKEYVCVQDRLTFFFFPTALDFFFFF